jgi:hypothetical protein
MSRLYATKTGIVIGSAWTPPPPAMSDDAIAIQRALMDRIAEKGHSVAPWVGIAILCILAAAAITGAQ